MEVSQVGELGWSVKSAQQAFLNTVTALEDFPLDLKDSCFASHVVCLEDQASMAAVGQSALQMEQKASQEQHKLQS